MGKRAERGSGRPGAVPEAQQAKDNPAMPPIVPRSPEDELLLLLVHGRHSPHRDARLRALLGASRDWTSLLRQADLHGVVKHGVVGRLHQREERNAGSDP